ncbi:hypothetical protein CYMTET_7346 [Cymbomonas tetramitiformis]|uniref:Uncharacterized protein n=1 Tax=Cymbomonas tetramitiformis TaxID=36881 RepID=A0AAE0LHJ8_9CHLO|nr:hypothetical protein CYMTET_7346 [Cymbomonas tetramitiformis]
MGVVVGLGNVFFPKLVKKCTAFVEAVLASGYFEFIDSVQSVSMPTLFTVFMNFVFLVTGSFSLTVAALEIDVVNQTMDAMVVGYSFFRTLVDPESGAISRFLFYNFVGCKEPGKRTEDFPSGIPECDPDKDETCDGCVKDEQFDDPRFLTVFLALKTIHWGVTLAIGYVATNKRFKEFLESFGGTTIIGADLFISSMTMVIINMMMMYDHYADTKLASAYNKQLLGYAAAGATYTLAFIGITVQVGMKLPTIEHEIQDPKAPGGKMMLNIDGYEYPDLKDVPLKVHEDTTKGYPIRNLEGKTLTLPAKATSIIFTQSLLRYVYWIMNFVEDVIEELLKVKHGQEATISIPGMPKALVKILTSSLKSGELNSESITDILTLANDGAEDIPKTAENLFHKSTEYAKEQGRKQEESVKTKVAETTDKKTGEGKAKIAKVKEQVGDANGIVKKASEQRGARL